MVSDADAATNARYPIKGDGRHRRLRLRTRDDHGGLCIVAQSVSDEPDLSRVRLILNDAATVPLAAETHADRRPGS